MMDRYWIMVLWIAMLAFSSHSSAIERLVDLNRSADWQPAHDITSLQDLEVGFQFQATDTDPYMISRTLGFSALRYAAVLFELKATAGSQTQLFWTRKDDPNFSEGKSMRLPLVADDRFHGYTLSLSKHVEWTGEINRLRLDPTDKKAAVTIRSFQIVDRIGPIIQPVFFYPNSPCTKVGNPIQLKARFRNEGDEEGKVFLQLKGLSNNLKIDNPAGIWLTVEAGKERDAVWIVSASNDCAEVVTCAWEAPESAKSGTTSGSMQSIVQVVDTQQVLDRGVLSEGDYRLTFCRTDLGYGPMLFSLKKRDTFETVALMPRLGTVKIQHDDNSVGLYPLFYKQAQSGWNSENGAERFAVDWRDRDGRLWEFSLTIQKSKTIQGVFLFCHSLKSDGGKLLHFSGPELYIGEGTFGQAKDMAVFPGIEYLDRDAISSSDAVAHPPVRDQYIPHPYKNTIPFMSLTHDEMMVSLLWPANAKWVDGHNGLSPVFAVPNRFHGQNNHLFSLVVPPVPDSRMENQDTAFEPFLMSKGEPIQILSAVQLAHSNDPNDALETWLKLFAEDRLPEPMPAPRSYAESIQLSRQAYLTSCWDEKAMGWGHCAGWKAYPSGGMLALLDLDAFLNTGGRDREEVRNRVDRVYNHIVETQGSSGLGSSVGCHVMNFEPAFYWGVTEHTLPGWLQQTVGMKQSQNEDGSWGFHPGNSDQATLGKNGEVVSGTISPNAMFLMRLARISADPVATETGLKALEALNCHTVPRGAQGWECPIAAADILVSGHGTRANLDAFRITGERRYLEKAVYWARSGIIFHYLWNLKDRPLQRYACIPIFGTTFFTHSWLGVPVQWCGLVYAYALQELTDFDTSMPWRSIARGIVNSALYQQMTEGKYIGTLPDSYGDYFLTARGAWINPENILTNLHALEGNSLNIRTVFPGIVGKEAIRISANADVDRTELSDRSLRFSLVSKKGRKTEILIAPLDKSPKGVGLSQEKPLAMETSLFEKPFGWRYISEQKILIIHVTHGEESIPIYIDF